jgi:hypothetical protein
VEFFLWLRRTAQPGISDEEMTRIVTTSEEGNA